MDESHGASPPGSSRGSATARHARRVRRLVHTVEGSTVMAIKSDAGVEVVVEHLGSGSPTILVLPGGGQARERWTDVGRTLAQHGTGVVLMDHRGHGDSGWSAEGSYEITDYARDVHHVLRELDRPTIVIGHSMGGRIAIEVAASEREVGAVVLVDAVPDMISDDFGNSFLAATASGFDTIEDARRAMEIHYNRPISTKSIASNLRRGSDQRHYWHWDPAVLNRVLADMASETVRLRQAAAAIDVPTCLIRTEYSNMVDDDSVNSLRELLADLEVCTLAGSPHHRPWSHPIELSSLIIDFIGRLGLITERRNDHV